MELGMRPAPHVILFKKNFKKLQIRITTGETHYAEVLIQTSKL